MISTINIRKGLDLPIGGGAAMRTEDARGIRYHAVKPTDYIGLVPRLLVKEGDSVGRGEALLCDKWDDRIRLCSPVEGCVKAIVRGDRRKLLAVVVESNGTIENTHPVGDAVVHTRQATVTAMIGSGLWCKLVQRPFGCIPNPDSHPKALVVSCFDTAPLAPDTDYTLQGREADLRCGIEALATLTDGIVHVCMRQGQRLAQTLQQISTPNVALHYVKGPHPAGNIGPQIARICPINKGEQVWSMGVQDIATLGHLLRTGEYYPERVVAVAGPAVAAPHYYRVFDGVCVEGLVQGCQPHSRIISGNVLTGIQVEPDGFLGARDSLVTLLPEGDHYDFMGWLMPGWHKYSFSRTFVSGWIPTRCHHLLEHCKLLNPHFDTNTHGDVRPLVFSGDFERFFPFDIYPTQLIKACIVGDMELQEQLGIYEVEPEDFALCEYIDPSKTDIQPIIRETLEILRKEACSD